MKNSKFSDVQIRIVPFEECPKIVTVSYFFISVA